MAVNLAPEMARAWADAMEDGFSGTFEEFGQSEAGQKAAALIAAEAEAENRRDRKSWTRRMAADMRMHDNNITSFSNEAAKKLRDALNLMDLDNVPEDTQSATRKRPLR